MSKKRLKIICIGCVLSLSFLAAQVSILPVGEAHAKAIQLNMGTASVGGTFANIGAALAQCVNQNLPEVNITAGITQGSMENLRLIAKKQMQLATITPQFGAWARKGVKRFKGEKINFGVLVRLIPNAAAYAVLAKSKVKTIRDLKGHKVGVGPSSGGLGATARTQLAAQGINYKKDITPFFLGAGAMVEALKDGTVESAMIVTKLIPMLVATHKIRILKWDEKDLQNFVKENPAYGVYTFPANRFKGVDYPFKSIDNGIQLISSEDMSDDLAYKLTKAVVENLDCLGKTYAPAKTMTPEWAAKELANPFHPSAIKYFKEIGVWKK